MTAERVPWSWLAWAMSSLLGGSAILAGFLFADLSEHFLRYADAELAANVFFLGRGLNWYLISVLQAGGFVALWSVLARFVGNLTRRPAAIFAHLMWLGPSMALIGLHLFAVVANGFGGVRWDLLLMDVTMVAGFYAAAQVYLFVVRRTKGTA